MALEVQEYFVSDSGDWKNHGEYQKAFEQLMGDLKAGDKGGDWWFGSERWKQIGGGARRSVESCAAHSKNEWPAHDSTDAPRFSYAAGTEQCGSGMEEE